MNLEFNQPFEASMAERYRAVSAEVPGLNQEPSNTVSLQDITSPNRVKPNDTFEVNPAVRNAKCLTADVNHPDYCFIGLSSGWRIRVGASLGDSQDARGNCHGCGSRKNYPLELTAPAQPGSYTLEVEVVGANTGDTLGRQTTEIVVEEEAPDRQDPDVNQSPLERILGDVPGIGGGSGLTIGLAVLVLVLVLLLVVGVAV
jgi:hypothetical protein